MANDEPAPSVDARAAQGVQIGDGNIQINVLPPRTEILRPWMSPGPSGPVVERPDLYAALLRGVTREGTGPATLTTALEGAGGFGKTTLAAALCQDSRIAARFTGGLLGVTVGESSRGGQLAELVGGLCEVLSGTGVTTTDPQAAGGLLGGLLDNRGPILLVVDDVWRREQLAPFLIGGRSCQRLITTRNKGVAPPNGVSIAVDAMTTEQAVATLTDGVGEVPQDLLTRLISVTNRWPLLLSLVNATLTDQLAVGAGVRQAVEWVLTRLETDGPAAFDMDPDDEGDRSTAVQATVDASLGRLKPKERERYLDLAILPEDTHLPAKLLSHLWRTTGGMTESETEKLRMRLVQLRLALPHWQGDTPAIGLHDVLSSCLRYRLADHEIAARHESMVRTAAGLLLPPPLPPDARPGTPWWTMHSDEEYLWRRLPYHLANSGRGEERDTLVCDLRWVAAKATALGSSVPVELDLADVRTDSAQLLREALGTITHLLTAGDPPEALDATLYGYMAGVPELESLVAPYRHHLSGPRLVPAWPLPDQPRSGFLRVLTGHVNGVSHCVFSSDGTLLASTSHDGTARVWDVLTGGPLQILTGHVGAVSACAFSPHGNLLATAGHDHTTRLWDIRTGEQLHVLTGHSDPVTSCAISPDGNLLATAGHDHTTRLWELPTGKPLKTLTGHQATVAACTFSPDGTQLATAGHDLTARVWDVATGEQRGVLDDHCESVTACAFSPDGALLATAGHDARVRLWRTQADSYRAQPWPRWEYACAFSPDGDVVATAGYERTVQIWDVSTGGLRQMLEGHTDTVGGCAYSPDGTLLATASHDRTVRLWDTDTGAVRAILTGHREEVVDCVFSPDGALIASASRDDTVRLWNTTTGAPVRILAGHTGAVSSCTFSPDGTLVASASHDHTVRLWETATGRPRAVLTGHTDLVSSCAFAPDGAWIASASHDRTVKVWDVATGEPRQNLHRHTSGVLDCVYAPDGTLITTDIVERRIRMWRPGSDEPWCGTRVVTPLLRLAWHPGKPLLCAVGESGVYLFRFLPAGVRDDGS